jgi:hypothetical protein
LSVSGVSQVDDLRLPRKIDGVWTPYNPGDYLPYASRQRWFRTPNDAFMTANFHVAAGMLTKVLKIEPFAPFQLLLATTYSGAFHPTAEGQAAIADAVVEKARAVLAKYGEGPDADASYLSSIKPDDALPAAVDEPGREIPDVKAVITTPAAGAPAFVVEPETKGVKAVVSGPDDVQVGVMPQTAQPQSGVLQPVTGAATTAPLPAAGAAGGANVVGSEPLAPPVGVAAPNNTTQPETGLDEAKELLAPPKIDVPLPVAGSEASAPDTKAPATDAATAPAPPASGDASTGALPETAIRPFAPASGSSN